MCGICGMVYQDTSRRPLPEIIDAMCKTITHRGPDDQGVQIIGQAGLGMRRLSIIDLSTGHQPLSNEDESIWIVFNGEIYNFQELRKTLQFQGHSFRTNSDTETLVHGYESWGTDLFQHLNGMFGFAIWDSRRHRLLIGRDRLGIKPLYYYHDSERLIFGSEIKAILKAPGIDKEIDLLALNNFLTFEYVSAPKSIFKKIKKLPPGHFLLYENGKVDIQPYWQLEPKEEDWTEAAASERLRELMEDSVRLRLISDVPLGAFLSGGIDSTILVSQMAKLNDRPVKTFSIGFKESSYNELKYARAVAKKYETEHHEFTIEANALELTEKLAFHLDEPFGDFSIFPTYLVSKMARDHVTVSLSGDGGDELFAGYDTYRAHQFDRRYYRHIPALIRKKMIGPWARSLLPTEQKKGLVNSIKRFVEGAGLSESLYHARWMTFLQENDREQLFSADAFNAIRDTDPYEPIHAFSLASQFMDDVTRTGYIDVNTYLVDNILVKVDRMSMATSLEARVPFLDHRIVEFAFSLPSHLKMRGFKTKALLNRTFWDEMPPEVQNRDKQGFSIPIKNWIRNELKSMMLDLLEPTRIQNQGLFNPTTINRLMDAHLKGEENHSHRLWALMMFQQWYDLYAK
ncbi:asparagine synthase (glutamine-hydrolyzing) [candidate division KSB1 bacterium]|nr:asparagine synthase (glutamine-hydrolyzing) [candidate division KSB1 bacterium]